jgi:hypothetical protein
LQSAEVFIGLVSEVRLLLATDADAAIFAFNFKSARFEAGLPDGLFSKQKSQFG